MKRAGEDIPQYMTVVAPQQRREDLNPGLRAHQFHVQDRMASNVERGQIGGSAVLLLTSNYEGFEMELNGCED
jgi:hypothetical protein